MGRMAPPGGDAISGCSVSEAYREVSPEAASDGCGHRVGVRVTNRRERHGSMRRKNHGASMDRPGTVRMRGAWERKREKTMILTTRGLKAQFEANLAQSSCVDIATAWATEGPVLDLLCKVADVEDVEVRAIVGTYGKASTRWAAS